MLATNSSPWSLGPSPLYDDISSQPQPQQLQQHHSKNGQSRYLTLVQLLMVVAAFPLQSYNPISSHGLRSVSPPQRLLSTTSLATTGAWFLATTATSMVAQAGPVGVTGAGDGEAPGEKKPPVKAAPAGAPNPGPGPGTHAPGPNTNSHINNNNNGTHTNTTPTSGTAPKAAPSVKPARLSTCSGQQTTPCTISTQEAAPKAAEKPHHAPVSNSRAGSAVPASGEDVDANGDGIPDNKQDGPSGPAKKDAATGPGGFSMTTIMVGAGSVFALVAVLVGAVVVRKRRQRRARHTSGSLSGGVGGRGEPFDDEHYMSYSGGVKRMTNHPNTRSGSGLESPYSSKPSSTIGSTYGNTIGGNAKAERQPEQFWNP